ncbi:MAG: hypothetical protein HZA70_06280 [Planctomycetes bacterium]|nr:hypothetical protein [Planctomycetota bacterium]
MYAGTEVPTEYYEIPTVPLKAPATGTIGLWRYEAQEKEGNKIKTIYEGTLICVIDAESGVKGLSTPKRIEAPSKGYIDKIIKQKDEPVTEGEVIAEWMPFPTFPLEILDRYGFSSIG